MELLQKEMTNKNEEIGNIENELDDLYEAYLTLKEELEELENE